MSNLFLKRTRGLVPGALAALTWGHAAALAAQAPPAPRGPAPARDAPALDVAATIDALAQFMVDSSTGPQPTVPYPEDARPELPVALCSIAQPVCVHADDAAAEPAEALLGEVEAALATVAALGFPVPRPDGGAGGTLELDVYLAPPPHAPRGEGARRAWGEVDGPSAIALLDGATSYARLDPRVPPARRFACAVEAIAEAGLRADDPAESRLASGALAAFVAYLATGSYGCVDRVEAAQLAPEAGLSGAEADAIATLQLALVLISRRHDGGDGAFVREVWQLARQRSREVDALRISPSFFEALERALQNSGESLAAITEELAVARYFATRGALEGASRALPALPASIGVPITAIKPYAELPAHLPVHEPLLGPLGSAYAQIDTAGAPAGSRLDVWLRGDVGPLLVLTAVRLDARGREVGRMTAPARRVPQSFLPIELSAETASVVLVVTSLVKDLRALGYDEITGSAGFRLILDKS